MKRQKDEDARWTKKHGKSHYGYKNHINVDKEHKLIRRYAVTDASVHDSQVFDELLDDENSDHSVWADSAYRSEPREERLHNLTKFDIAWMIKALSPTSTEDIMFARFETIG